MPPTVPTRLHPADLALIVAYLIGITLFGLRFRAKKTKGATPAQSLQSYFLADNTIPWWAIALSIVSAETSTLTIISIPGVAFAGDMGFLQVVLGYMLGRVVVAALFLPRYFEGRMLTAYQLIDQRFGSTLHKVTAALFLITRAAAEGVRVFAVSIVVGIAIGTGDLVSIALITALTLLYTFEGGMAAVIWTDVVQMAIYVAGTAVALITLGRHIPGGWHTIHQVAGAAGKFHILHFAFNLTQSYTFWAGILGGTFLTMASHGTDQLMVQRMLAARNLRESRIALLSSGVLIFIQFAFFLLIGAGLYVFYGMNPTHFTSADRIFPTFIVQQMPTGVAGLLIAAILAAAMSNLSAALNSLSSTTIVDFYLNLRSPKTPGAPSSPDSGQGGVSGAINISPSERNLAAKLSTILWAIILFAVAAYSLKAGGKGHVVETGLSIASVAYGALLGVFLLGTLTRYATQTGAILGMIVGFTFNMTLWLTPPTAGLTYTTQGKTHLLQIPHIAFTWYVFLGALVTFAVGSLASLLFRKQSKSRRLATIATILLLATTHAAQAQSPTLSSIPPRIPVILSAAKNPRIVPGAAQTQTPTYDFTPITTLITQAIQQKKLPGAVVLIGHNNQIVFEQAYGVRKLAGEPGPSGTPTPAEPMTEDTIFDMASLTKCLVTATAIMQLYEQGKLAFDDPIQKYLPAFNPDNDPQRAKVTIRLLLTHYSGEPEDVDLKDPWGLTHPDKAEGIHRALTTPLKSTPGITFRYSDINFITLGALVEKLSGQPEDVYATEHIFKPLGMAHTRYLPYAKCCGPAAQIGAATILNLPKPPAGYGGSCPGDFWDVTRWIPNTAPTAHDNELTPEQTPDSDHLLRGTVHDPTTRRMGGVAGHAGVFSTAHDMSLYAQALLSKLLHNTGPFPLKQSTLQLMIQPHQPPTAESTATIFAPNGQTTKGVAARAYGWDLNSPYSRPRGEIFPIGSFGHTGFTGTSLWIDPTSDTYVILLANAIHPHVTTPISTLRGQIATAAAQALHICPPSTICDNVIVTSDNGQLPISPPSPQTPVILSEAKNPRISPEAPPTSKEATNPGAPSSRGPIARGGVSSAARPSSAQTTQTQTGIDVLEATHFKALTDLAAAHQNHLTLALLTNQSGQDAHGNRTIDILKNAPPNLTLTTLFTPEHGLYARQDSTTITQETDPTTHLPVISLYGAKESQRRPSHEQLANLDAVVIDLQDAGVRFWTYETILGYFLEASACESARNHPLDIIVLDRPNPIAGLKIEGPQSDYDPTHSYINYTPIPLRHGLTFAELARYFAILPNSCATPPHLTVVPMQNWQRPEYYDQTQLPWINPSPNLRSVTANILYPGLGLFDATPISVGRGSPTPFEQIAAPYLNPTELIAYLNARKIPGVTFTPTTLTIAEDPNHYPGHGQTLPAVHCTVIDRNALNSVELGLELISALRHLYPTRFPLEKVAPLLASKSTMQALEANQDPRAIAATWASDHEAFRRKTAPILLYPMP
jgi:SSS family transporter